jgi:hypothetical protein
VTTDIIECINLLIHIIAQQVVIKQFDIDYHFLEEYSLFGRDSFFDYLLYLNPWKLKKILQLTSTICSCRLDRWINFFLIELIDSLSYF